MDYQGDLLDVGTLQERDDAPLDFLELVWRSGDASVGFKWTRGQNEQVLTTVLNDTAVSKIILRRRNRVKTFVSERIAQLTNQWEVYSKDDLIMPRPQITVDPQDLLQHIALNEQFYEELMEPLARPGQSYLELEYESLFDRSVQDRTFEFLGVDRPNNGPTADSVKQNPNDLRESIVNFAELSEQLASAELTRELHELGM